jgi:hypothetical protein
LRLTQPQLTVFEKESEKLQSFVDLQDMVESAIGENVHRISIRVLCKFAIKAIIFLVQKLYNSMGQKNYTVTQ